MGLSIRPFEREDLDSVSALVKDSGLNTQLDQMQWQKRAEWLYFESGLLCSAPDIPAGFVAEIDEEPQGFIGLSCRRFRTSEGIFDAVALGDLAVRPHARGNLGLILSREVIKTFESFSRPVVILGLHHNKISGAIWRMFGAIPVEGSQTTFTGIVSPGSIVARRLHMPPAAVKWLDGAVPCSWWKRLLAGSSLPLVQLPKLNDSIEVTTANTLEFTSSLNSILDMVQISAPAGIVRDRAYLAWRYQLPIEQDALFLHVFDKAEQIGFVVLKINREGMCFLSEVLLQPTRQDLIATVVAAALTEAAQMGAGSLAAKMTGPGFPEAFCVQGLRQSDKEYYQYWIYPKEHAISDTTFTFGDFRSD